MKRLADYLIESQQWINTPSEGDDFAIELPDEVLVETYIIEVADDCILLDATTEIIAAIGESALLEDTDKGESGIVMETMGYGSLVGEKDEQLNEFLPALAAGAARALASPFVRGALVGSALSGGNDEEVDEAEYQGRKVALGKPMQGDVKKFKVYVKDPKTGNVKKVNFGDKTMRIKKSNPARRKSFRARHNCANPGPRTKARYWSCRKW
jgi:hypothetical protein